ncbi:hypothetical protein [Escherichia coli]|uniref:hypothetical protein n=1 Tax=Escherichia coli TaxID=562 RepID=UPI00202BAE57|nr:hypothetical protein [Escherichia coli]
MMSLWDALRMNMMISYQELVRTFLSIIGVLLAALSIILGLPIIVDYIDTGLVRRFPTAFLTASIMLSSIMAFVCGIILHSNTTTRREMKALFYLSEKKL